MKIQRFINESVNNPLLDEPWTMEKFKKIENMKKQINADEDQLLKLLTKYLLLNPDIQDEPTDLYPNETEVTSYEFLINPMYIFAFSFIAESFPFKFSLTNDNSF